MKKKIEDNCVELDERLDKEIKQTECQNDRDKKKTEEAGRWVEREKDKKKRKRIRINEEVKRTVRAQKIK